MELAYATRATLPTLPPPSPHLRGQLPHGSSIPEPAPDLIRGRALAGQARRADDGRLRVGLLWAASDWDATRSIPLQVLAPLFTVDEVQFFSLQQGRAAADPLLQRLDIERLSPRTFDIERAAAAMCDLNLVISVDGMPAHLAGTLGRPTWVLLKHQADWRWMEDRNDTPWYPTLRLFRQPRADDWTAVAHQVTRALRDAARAQRRSEALSAGLTAR
jgi:hypothetical protein